MALIPITDDLYDIARRLRSVDDDYRLLYNTDKNRYEVHSAARGAIQFVVPFDEADARTVDYALRTRVQNAEAIFAEVERHNERTEARHTAAAAEAAYNLIKEKNET